MEGYSREQAYELLGEYTKTENLIKHALSVEAAMRYFAKQNGEDEELWATAGLLHDIDYEMYPEEHCQHTEEILAKGGVPQVIIRACLSHGYGICTDVEPESAMEKTLYAVDELTGLITACVLVRPSKNIEDLKLKSVKKKWKDARFAAGANREVITDGAARMGIELDDLISGTIEGMKEAAQELGLAG